MISFTTKHDIWFYSNTIMIMGNFEWSAVLNISQIYCCAEGDYITFIFMSLSEWVIHFGKTSSVMYTHQIFSLSDFFRLISTVKVVIFHSAIKILIYTIRTTSCALILLLLHCWLLSRYHSSDSRCSFRHRSRQ